MLGEIPRLSIPDEIANDVISQAPQLDRKKFDRYIVSVGERFSQKQPHLYRYLAFPKDWENKEVKNDYTFGALVTFDILDKYLESTQTSAPVTQEGLGPHKESVGNVFNDFQWDDKNWVVEQTDDEPTDPKSGLGRFLKLLNDSCTAFGQEVLKTLATPGFTIDSKKYYLRGIYDVFMPIYSKLEADGLFYSFALDDIIQGIKREFYKIDDETFGLFPIEEVTATAAARLPEEEPFRNVQAAVESGFYKTEEVPSEQISIAEAIDIFEAKLAKSILVGKTKARRWPTPQLERPNVHIILPEKPEINSVLDFIGFTAEHPTTPARAQVATVEPTTEPHEKPAEPPLFYATGFASFPPPPERTYAPHAILDVREGKQIPSKTYEQEVFNSKAITENSKVVSLLDQAEDKKTFTIVTVSFDGVKDSAEIKRRYERGEYRTYQYRRLINLISDFDQKIKRRKSPLYEFTFENEKDGEKEKVSFEADQDLLNILKHVAASFYSGELGKEAFTKELAKRELIADEIIAEAEAIISQKQRGNSAKTEVKHEEVKTQVDELAKDKTEVDTRKAKTKQETEPEKKAQESKPKRKKRFKRAVMEELEELLADFPSKKSAREFAKVWKKPF